ncbi:UDP-3-O-(3-hydroxymyristoyl)glucosamine N-acyltransferase [Desulfonatronum thioautotrophicum]|uniref:UDP-3-O-(3-hydroxymyristoyl)glucosamine N-acyltransferase n=1 Tax=Desulfonatronum thioautotrophicum TaxID=617001 RepID=UPI0005EB0DFF|nr:UDP-3-O-(3-hydroxymyristoyl)glucosamine N-acyltransferase [Desulfonatronum thioautotrophicum]
MTHKLSELAQLLGLPLQGPDLSIQGVAALDHAGPEDLSFLAGPKHLDGFKHTEAGAVIVPAELIPALVLEGESRGRGVTRQPSLLISSNSNLDFTRAVRLFAVPQGRFTGQSEAAHVHPTARLDPSVIVYPFVFVGEGVEIGKDSRLFSGVYVGEECRIGKRVTIYPNAVLHSGTVIGDDVIIHAGTVLGSDGFGYVPGAQGLEKVPQVGNVVVEDRVEIGANTTIDRASLGTTRIGVGTKIDNLVQIGHNVEVGDHCILVSQVGIAGSSKLGDRVTLAGQVGIADHLHLGDGCRVGAKAGVNRSLAGGQDYLGSPAVEARKFMRIAASWNRLPEMAKRLAAMEKEIESLKKNLCKDES